MKLMRFKVVYQYLDDRDCKYSVVFDNVYELAGGLNVLTDENHTDKVEVLDIIKL